MSKFLLLLFFGLWVKPVYSQGPRLPEPADTLPALRALPPQLRAYAATSALLDATLTSLNSLNSLIKKENYRNRISSFNNPASSDLGFSLEAEIQTALRPILSKVRQHPPERISGVISSLIGSGRSPAPVAGLFPAIAGFVGNLTIQEKRVTRNDLDTFLLVMSRYFSQYEKLHTANQRFEEQIERLNRRLLELQFDIREYALDLVQLLHAGTRRNNLRDRNLEELLLQYLDLSEMNQHDSLLRRLPPFPADAVKGAKDICNMVQKLFREYQKIYQDNYTEIRTILQGCRSLARNGTTQLDQSLRDLEELYQQSAQADVLNLRLSTLQGRLQALVQATRSFAGG